MVLRCCSRTFHKSVGLCCNSIQRGAQQPHIRHRINRRSREGEGIGKGEGRSRVVRVVLIVVSFYLNPVLSRERRCLDLWSRWSCGSQCSGSRLETVLLVKLCNHITPQLIASGPIDACSTRRLVFFLPKATKQR